MATGERAMKAFTLQELAERVKERAAASPDVSYTRKLLDKGVAHCAKKLGEEAIETALAAVGEDRAALIAEAADLLYHLLVVLESRGVAIAEVEAALARRMTRSGLEETASPARSRSANRPPRACSRRCWRAGPIRRRSSSSPPTAFSIPTRCSSAKP